MEYISEENLKSMPDSTVEQERSRDKPVTSHNRFIRGIRKRAAVAVLGTLLLFGCGRPEEQRVFITPESSPEPKALVLPDTYVDPLTLLDEKLSQKELQIPIQIVNKLNDPKTSEAEYDQIIDEVPSNIPVYPFLVGKEPKIRFIEEVLQRDTLDQIPYVNPDYGPDINKDGVIEIRTVGANTYNEAGHKIDMTRYICQDFATELVRRYGVTTAGRNISPTNLWLPMFVASTSEGYTDNLELRRGRGHAFNGVFIGDSPNQITDPASWVFIEPQTDEIKFSGVTSETIAFGAAGSPGAILDISVPDINTGGTFFSPLYPVIGFANHKYNGIVPVSAKALEIIHKFEDWVTMQRVVINKYPDQDLFVLDEPDLGDFTQEQINEAVGISLNSGFMPPGLVQDALSDSKLP